MTSGDELLAETPVPVRFRRMDRLAEGLSLAFAHLRMWHGEMKGKLGIFWDSRGRLLGNVGPEHLAAMSRMRHRALLSCCAKLVASKT